MSQGWARLGFGVIAEEHTDMNVYVTGALGNILAGVLQSRLLPKRWIFLSQTTRN
jgi:hypothetical protein